MKRSMKNKLANGRPKKALAPYMFFCKDQRENITGDNPNISFGDVGRILGSQWQSMSEKDRMVCMKTPSVYIYFPILHEIPITHQNDYLHTPFISNTKNEPTIKISYPSKTTFSIPSSITPHNLQNFQFMALMHTCFRINLFMSCSYKLLFFYMSKMSN